jgi:hypothetical protein
MDFKDRRPIIFLVLAFLLGWVIGLFLFGWSLTPVRYTEAGFQHLRQLEQNQFLITTAELYALTIDDAYVKEIYAGWNDADQAICDLAIADGTNPAQARRLNSLAAVLNDGSGCADFVVAAAQQAEPEEAGGRSLGANIAIILGLLIALGFIIGAIFFVWQRRVQQTANDEETGLTELYERPMLEEAEPEQQVTPLARFETTYVRGHDTYDDSFSVENSEGDFLGECGVGLSETIGADMPKNVTALVVWLFDKNDIRTVTKVVMSDHAFFDEAIKAKLAPKGEPMLARPDDVIVLETASLIVNAVITEMEYGTGTLPPQSFFERITIELSAWAKEGDFAEPDMQGRVDEILEY